MSADSADITLHTSITVGINVAFISLVKTKSLTLMRHYSTLNDARYICNDITIHLFAPVGIEYPRVIKSPSLRVPDSPEENKLFRLSFIPNFRFLFRSFSSLSTLAVSDAVAA